MLAHARRNMYMCVRRAFLTGSADALACWLASELYQYTALWHGVSVDVFRNVHGKFAINGYET